GTNLADGNPHTLHWQRDPAGQVSVTLDGRSLLELRDDQGMRGFDGLVIACKDIQLDVRSVALSVPAN
ncbi:MAG: hypothetical protein KDK91_29885, partial [Gammaproteobacteria bacterium]|nr:hypothetical protein [Gammaproteobacteria bacterium]